MNLPGRCMGCGADVVWRGRSWKDPKPEGVQRNYRKHVCPIDRPTCGAWMRYAKERCARRPGHAFDHRTAYAMANARRKGLAA